MTKADGSEVDSLELGIKTETNTNLGTLTATVTGPNGFSYTFTDSDAHAWGGTLALWKQYDSLTPLAPGTYTFTVTDSLGNSVSQADLHIDPHAVPLVNEATIGYQRLADGSYRFSWAPADAARTYYYRFRLYDSATADVPIFDTSRMAKTWFDVPAGTLTDGQTYYWRVETHEVGNWDLLKNRGATNKVAFTPQATDYDPNQVVLNYTKVLNLKLADGSRQTALNIDVDDENALTLAEVDGPNGFHYTFDLTADKGYDLWKTVDPATTPTGLYTFHLVAGGVDYYSYDYLTAKADYQLPAPATQQVEDLGNGMWRFSWAPVEQPVPLWYRVRVRNTGNGAKYDSPRLDQAMFDIGQTDLVNTIGTGSWTWEVLVYDSSDWTTARNRVNGAAIAFNPLPYNPNRPQIWPFSSHRVSGTGNDVAYTWATTSDPNGDLVSLQVDGPAGSNISYDLLQQGSLYIGGSYRGYMKHDPGLPVTGLYTYTATDASGNQMVRYDYQSSPVAYAPIDFKTLHIDRLADGRNRVSWAPVNAQVPLYYRVEILTVADHNGDGYGDETLLSPYQATTSWVYDPATLPAEPLVLRLRARENPAGTAWNNRTHSIHVGLEAPGFDYSTLADQDNDGWASNIDPDDADPDIYPPLPQQLTLVTPNGGEMLSVGATTKITWLPYPNAASYLLRYSTDGGTTWKWLRNNVTGTSFNWTVPNSLSDQCLLRINAKNAAGSFIANDFSDTVFSIINPPQIISPNGGEAFAAGSTITISWYPHPNAVNYLLRYSTDAGASWKWLRNNVTGTSFNWKLPDISNSQVMIRINAKNAAGSFIGNDFSDSTFSIVQFRLTSPNGGETLNAGDNLNITWQPHPNAASYLLRYSVDNGTTWKWIRNGVTGTSFNWTVPVDPSTQVLFRINAKDAAGNFIANDFSDAVSSIVVPLKVLSPNGGETLTIGSQTTISWNPHPDAASYLLRYSIDGGTTWKWLRNNVTGTSFNWTVPNDPSTQVLMRINAKNAAGSFIGNDFSDATFTIVP
ncbi:GPI anchored serine-threonine rich family protein [Geothermobacter hydrogeniphilus]|nr:GPI anchored serine-threonine rich family protein [Geothermobacter hydrogeniphilus]